MVLCDEEGSIELMNTVIYAQILMNILKQINKYPLEIKTSIFKHLYIKIR